MSWGPFRAVAPAGAKTHDPALLACDNISSVLAPIALIIAHLTSPAAGKVFRLHMSEVCIPGSHLDAVVPLLKSLKYRLVGKVREVGSDEVGSFLNATMPNNHRVRKAAYIYRGWTHIVDTEMVIMTEETTLAKLSKSLGATIVTWIAESSSNTTGFSLFEKGFLKRRVWAVGGQADAKGKRIPAEGKIDWSKASESDLMDLVTRLGPVYGELGPGVRYRLYDLDELP